MQTGMFISLLGIMFVSLLVALRVLRNWQKRRLVEAGFTLDHHLALGLFGVAVDFQRCALVYFKIGKIFIVNGALIDSYEIVPEHRIASLFNPAPPKFWLNIFTLDPNIPVIRVPFSSEKEALQWRIYLHQIQLSSVAKPSNSGIISCRPKKSRQIGEDIFASLESEFKKIGYTPVAGMGQAARNQRRAMIEAAYDFIVAHYGKTPRYTQESLVRALEPYFDFMKSTLSTSVSKNFKGLDSKRSKNQKSKEQV